MRLFFMVNMACGMHCSRVHLRTTKNDDVAQLDGHTPANRLTEACGLGLHSTSLILEIHDMII